MNLTAFPANRMEFNVLSFLIGAKRRIAIRYQVGHYETLGFFKPNPWKSLKIITTLTKNLSLLGPLGVNKLLYAEKDISWNVRDDEIAYAEDFLSKQQLTPQAILIGFHPGCNPAQGNILKRWPTAYFARLGDVLQEQFGAKILLFGDQSETSLKEAIRQAMKYPPIIPDNRPLLSIAALIKRCHLFVTNDSGLMHVAAAMGVPIISLFGPSDPRRNAPYGDKHTVLKPTCLVSLAIPIRTTSSADRMSAASTKVTGKGIVCKVSVLKPCMRRSRGIMDISSRLLLRIIMPKESRLRKNRCLGNLDE